MKDLKSIYLLAETLVFLLTYESEHQDLKKPRQSVQNQGQVYSFLSLSGRSAL